MITFHASNNKHVAFVDEEDNDIIQFNWTATDKGYLHRRFGFKPNRRHVYLHQLILERMLGRRLEKGEVPDHKDKNPYNNCRSNLRLATYPQNIESGKLRSDNTTGAKGVFREKRLKKESWIAKINFHGKQIHVGTFNTFEEARAKRIEAAKKIFGDDFVNEQ